MSGKRDMESESVTWRTASGCEGGACVEVTTNAGIHVRATGREETLTFTASTWTAFTETVKAA